MKKTLIAIALLSIFFSSCTKDGTLPSLPPSTKIKLIAGNFFEQSEQNNATLTRDKTDYYGNWSYTVDFTNKDSSTSNIYFYQSDDLGDPIGTVTIKCNFFGTKLLNGEYNGTGGWYITSADGTLKSISTGAGKLEYKEIDGGVDNFSQYFVNLEGVGK